MPSAHKYEGNGKALRIYLDAFGEGFQNGWRAVTTDLTPWELVYKNQDTTLESAGLDGFADGQRAGFKAKDAYAKKLVIGTAE